MNNEAWISKLEAWMAETSGGVLASPIVPIAPMPPPPSKDEPLLPLDLPHRVAPPRAQVVAITHHFPPAPSLREHPTLHLPGGEMPDLGILSTLMHDPAIGDILVNGTQAIYIDVEGKLLDSGQRFTSHEELWSVATRIVKSVGQQLSRERPMVDTRLPDGSRVNIIAPPMAVDGVSISIRKFPQIALTREALVDKGTLSAEMAAFLSACVLGRANILISGGTGSGKTTLLNALSAAIAPEERLVTIEDSAELRLQQPHIVRLEAKPALTADAAHHAVSVRDLVRNALRMRPDRIIVGESRGPEALDVLQAMNTGHDGSMTTLHANSPRDALSRLETMVAMAMPQLPTRLVRQQIASAIHLVIHMSRCKDGIRRVTHISEVAGMEGEIITMQDLVLYTEASADRPAQFRWANGAARDPLLADAARSSGLMRGNK